MLLGHHHYAVMGNPVQHSLSPIIHQLFARQTSQQLTYDKILIDLNAFEQQVQQFFNQGGCGLNITQPCKQRAFALCSNVTPRCAKAAAANTLWRDKHGHIIGDNTDGVGLMRDLARHINVTGKDILLLGAGGAARGILLPLLDAKPAQLTIVNRTPKKAQDLADEFFPAKSALYAELDKPFDLIINASSLHQGITLSPTLLTPSTLCYDLSYCITKPTPFVAWAISQRAIGIDGLGMLIEQAAEAYAIWHGVMPKINSVFKELRKTKSP